MRRFITALAALFLMLTASSAFADTTAIVNAHIYSMGPAGEVQSGTVLIRNGKIVAVGANVSVPNGANVIDAKGKVVTPGLYIVDTNLAALEVDLVESTVDTATKSKTLSAAFDIQYGIDPLSTAIPIARLAGITRALVTPGYAGGDDRELLFAGQGAIISLGEGDKTVARGQAAMVLELGESGASRAGGARGALTTALKADLADVRWYMRHPGSFNFGSARELRLSKADLDALIPVVRGRMPLIVSVHRAADISGLLKLVKEQRLKVVLSGAEEAWVVADEIAKARVPVILRPTTNLPANFERRGATMENAARLHAAGVAIAFAGDDGHRIRESRYAAGNAVSHGLPYRAALEALTRNPARMFGDTSTGSLERGKDADVVIWNGDPLEPLTQPEAVLIKGRVQPMDARTQELAKRYKTLNGDLPAAYKD